jgi:hypothetical protein
MHAMTAASQVWGWEAAMAMRMRRVAMVLMVRLLLGMD